MTSTIDYNWSAEVCSEAVFTRCYNELVKHMLPRLLVPDLVTQRYLTPEDADVVISPASTTSERSIHLLAKLKKSLRDERDYYQFFKILREETEHKGHQELEESIVEACERTCTYKHTCVYV